MKKLIVAVFLIVPFIGISQQCKGDCKNGKGTYKWPSGDKYVGEWVDSKFEGQGTYTFSNGDKYVGEWIEGERNGYGVMTNVLSNKQKKDKKRYYLIRYEGNWEDGKRHGRGTAYFSNGSEWTGKWIEGEQAEVENKNNDNIYNSDDIVGDYEYTVINLEESNPNNYYLNINIDGVSKDFVFDTGCTNFTFDKAFLNTLIKNGCDIKKTNIKGSKAKVASGEIVDLKVVILNNVKIGDYILNNVVASVGEKGTSFLCGIGLFNKFSNVEWNMNGSTLKLYK
jgi:hypothetical protein